MPNSARVVRTQTQKLPINRREVKVEKMQNLLGNSLGRKTLFQEEKFYAFEVSPAEKLPLYKRRWLFFIICRKNSQGRKILPMKHLLFPINYVIIEFTTNVEEYIYEFKQKSFGRFAFVDACDHRKGKKDEGRRT